ncbi:hypothetical protein [Streptomyces sp. ISL-100]|uniref:hypothetical protein n=1 Tax=Streptomyces sp. ISL-100 TaxID=2819173 RepID=UPI001BEBE02C|nr:hypothetical protein [Streptomyces sp. ISL-100]MBT2401149.1 hypothetical protein [Streptomyces sp. ISL-100]
MVANFRTSAAVRAMSFSSGVVVPVVSGMHMALTVAGVVAVVAALVATLTKRGENADAGAGGAHI